MVDHTANGACHLPTNSNGEVDNMAIEAQQNEIRREIDADPLVSSIQPLSVLINEYKDNQPFHNKLAALDRECKGFRRVRKDGCCFYRSYVFGIFEYLISNEGEKKARIAAFKKKLHKIQREQMGPMGYDLDTVQDFFDEYLEALSRLEASPSPSTAVEKILTSEMSNSLVVLSRFVSSSYLKMNAPLFEPFLEGYASINEYCQKEVDPMWVEAEQLPIMALTSSVDVAVCIHYVDGSGRGVPNKVVFPEGSQPLVHLLYRPGHYDVLYIK